MLGASVFIALATVVAADSCNFVDGVEYYHEDLYKIASSTAQSCCDACQAHPDCSHFTFEPSEVHQSHDCYLKSGNATVEKKAGSTSGWCRAPQPPAATNVTIQLSSSTPISTTEWFYAGWNIDTSANRGFFERDIGPNNPELQYLAGQLNPSVLRCGGTGNDHISYCGFNTSQSLKLRDPDGCLNATWWDNLVSLSEASNASLVFGLNILHRTSNGKWDPSQAEELLRYALQHGHRLWGLELGNEEDDVLSVDDTVDSFVALQALVKRLYSDSESNPRGLPAPVLLGPDPHSLHRAEGLPSDHDFEFLVAFAKETQTKYPGLIAAYTHHEYTELTADVAMDPSFLDNTYGIGRQVVEAIRGAAAGATRQGATGASRPGVWAGEIAGHNGGGVPGFAGMLRHSFWYADALGAKAKAGYGAVCRQDLIGASYGLLSDAFEAGGGMPAAGAGGFSRGLRGVAEGTDSIPGVSPITVHPDYWVNLLFGRVMGVEVFNATVAQDGAGGNGGGYLRAYAHSCRSQGADTAGGSPSSPCLALVLVNLHEASAFRAKLPAAAGGGASIASGAQWRVWQLGPVVGAGLDAPTVALNGKELVRDGSGKLPPIDPVSMPMPSTGVLELQPATITFVQVQE